MQKLLTAAAALAFMGSAAVACDYHKQHVTASADQSKPSVTMSTHDGMLPPVAGHDEKVAEAATPACQDGAKDCAPSAE